MTSQLDTEWEILTSVEPGREILACVDREGRVLVLAPEGVSESTLREALAYRGIAVGAVSFGPGESDWEVLATFLPA